MMVSYTIFCQPGLLYCMLLLPMQGFVSNKTSEQGDSSVDPLETLLYSVFVANSERMTVADLATILDVSVAQLQVWYT